ncbi:hypothetical protein [Ruegeria arenilitoris]|uniref:hypothetical protein n=1 Tax=Ruegeria arenilitoris TaxID=1173585 RepID=UPI00147BC258|nr:hypothetical protein [Ruegeria arenilitoris]
MGYELLLSRNAEPEALAVMDGQSYLPLNSYGMGKLCEYAGQLLDSCETVYGPLERTYIPEAAARAMADVWEKHEPKSQMVTFMRYSGGFIIQN